MRYAKHGKDSEAWKSALETMDLLIWSVNSKQALEERRKLASLLPGLLKRLNAGMQMVGVESEIRTRFFAKLMKCHTKVMSGAAAIVIKRGRARQGRPKRSTTPGVGRSHRRNVPAAPSSARRSRSDEPSYTDGTRTAPAALTAVMRFRQGQQPTSERTRRRNHTPHPAS